MRRNYSRLATIEERKNIRRTFLFGVLTIAFLIFLFTLGIPVLVKFTGFFTDLGKSQKPIDKTDTIPPAPPQIKTPADYTNKTSLDISGNTEAGATIKLFYNDETQEVLADRDGKFSFNFQLNKGENTISAIAKDTNGNESQKSPTYTIIFDNEPPKIEINSPADGAEFFGSKQRQLTIKGKTESEADLIINDRVVAVDDDGSFTFLTTLSEGENTFKIKATDKAGNTEETSLTVRFSP
jgi:hypothetical protein